MKALSAESGTHAWGTQPEMFGPRHEHRLGMIVRELERLPGNARVLDGAVGLGQLAARIQQRGHRVFGIDYSFEAALHVRRTSTVPVVVGDMTRMPFREGVFDGLTTGETLEHLDDDAGAAREIGRVLREGGTCIATVPALESLWSASDDYYEHRRRYSRAHLVSMFENGGLNVAKAVYWGFPIVLAYDTLFLLPMNKRRSRRNVEEDATLQSVAKVGRARGLVRLVRAVFALDALFAWVPFGPGLLVVAQKGLRVAGWRNDIAFAATHPEPATVLESVEGGTMSEYDKPSRAEDEYFAKQELERRKKWAQEQSARMAVDEKENLKKAHWMKCPKCGMDLAEIEFHGVKVDQCANCGGIYLDAGEIDQISKHDEGVMSRVFSIFR